MDLRLATASATRVLLKTSSYTVQAKGLSSVLHGAHQSNGVYQTPRAAGTQGSASCSSCALPLLSGPHDALQGAERRENKDNMYYTGRHRPGRTDTTPSGGASRKAGHPFIHSSLVGMGPAFSRVSAQRGPGIPAAPAHGCTSRSPDWPLPHSHS